MFLLFLGKPAACLPCSELTKAHYHTHTQGRRTREGFCKKRKVLTFLDSLVALAG